MRTWKHPIGTPAGIAEREAAFNAACYPPERAEALEVAASDNGETRVEDCRWCRGTGHPYCGTVYAGEGQVPCYDYRRLCRFCGGTGERHVCVGCDRDEDDCECGEVTP